MLRLQTSHYHRMGPKIRHKDKATKEYVDYIQIADPRAYNSHLLSNLTLGSLIVVIKQNHLQNLIFDFRKHRLNFRDFCHLNKKVDSKLPNYHEVNIVLDLFSSLRNACFHWENLAKQGSKKALPILDFLLARQVVA
ncbi:hypothetical protein [Helicobacter suis]|nr:hypothetical protein [Helicobacter suis]